MDWQTPPAVKAGNQNRQLNMLTKKQLGTPNSMKFDQTQKGHVPKILGRVFARQQKKLRGVAWSLKG